MSRAKVKELVPLNDQERVEANAWYEEWNKIVTAMVRGYKVPPDDVEDVVQQMFIEFIQGRYFRIYDPSKADKKTFMRVFVKRRIQQRWSKATRDPLKHCVPSEIENSEGDKVNVVEELIVDRVYEDMPSNIDVRHAVAALSDMLDKQGVRSIVLQGKIERSLKSVFAMLKDGYQQHEMATHLQYSEASVSVLVKKIRVIAEEMGLRQLL